MSIPLILTKGSRSPSCSWQMPAVLVFIATLTIVTMGFPSLLMLAGTVAYSVVANRWFGSLSGPTSWVAGIVTEASVLGGESIILAIVAPHAQSQFIYVLILIVPLVFALALWRWLVRSGRSRNSKTQDWSSGEPLTASIVIVLIESMFEAIKLRGHDFGLSWAMLGDARNQVVGTRMILASGGITVGELKHYPAMINALTSILDGASGRANLRAGVLMTRDIEAQAATFMLSTIAAALLFIAAVTETFSSRVTQLHRIPSYLTIPLIACASLGVGPFVLGLALSGGYLSAIGSLVFALCAVVLGMRIIRHYSNVALILLTLTLLLVTTSWTLLLVVPASLLLVGYLVAGRRLGRTITAGNGLRPLALSGITLAISMISLITVVIVLIRNQTYFELTLMQYGGIVSPDIHLFLWLGLASLAAFAIALNHYQRLIRLVPMLLFMSTSMTILWLLRLEPLLVSWPYYAIKTLWLATCCIIWVPFVILSDAVVFVNQKLSKRGVRDTVIAIISLIGSAMIIIVVATNTAFPFPFYVAVSGGFPPSPNEVSLVIREANIGGPFVIWDYYTSGDDQLGNFWSALAWDYTAKGYPRHWAGPYSSFAAWGYLQNGSVAALCSVYTHENVRLVTRSNTIRTDLKDSCPAYRIDTTLTAWAPVG